MYNQMGWPEASKTIKKDCGIPEDYVSKFDIMFKDTDPDKDQLITKYMKISPYNKMEWPEASKAIKNYCGIPEDYLSKYDLMFQNGMVSKRK